MKKFKTVLWGLLLVAIGVIWGVNASGIAHINIFFDGWWTLLIIIPCLFGLFRQREKTGNILGILIGVCLLLCCWEIISFALLWKLLLPAIVVLIGLKVVFNGLFENKGKEILKKLRMEGKTPKSTFSIFSGSDTKYDGEAFESAELTAVFGGLECDLRNALIDEDCAIQVSAIFGGIDILVPENVNVKVRTSNIFGGVSNKTSVHRDAPTLYVSGICMFGGVDIK